MKCAPEHYARLLREGQEIWNMEKKVSNRRTTERSLKRLLVRTAVRMGKLVVRPQFHVELPDQPRLRDQLLLS